MRRYPLLSFFVLAFLMTWGLAGIFFLFPKQVVALTMKEVDRYHPLFTVAASAPTLAAWIVILRVRGRQGLVTFWSRYLQLARWPWYAGIAAALIAFGFAVRAVQQFMGIAVPQLPFTGLSFAPFAAYYLISDPGPLGEEGGWRGFALPLLQRRFSQFWAAVILGAVWGIFHLPAFYIATLNQSRFFFPLFVAHSIALVLLMGAAYNATGGNIPLMIVIHWAANLIVLFVSNSGGAFLAADIGAFLLGWAIIKWRWPGRVVVDPIPGW